MIRDGSLPLTLEDQSTMFGEIPEEMIVAQIVGPSAGVESRLERTSTRLRTEVRDLLYWGYGRFVALGVG